MGKVGHIASVTAALAAALALGACGSGRSMVVVDGQNANVITVNASAEAKVVPDKASFNVEVYAEGATAEEAQQAGTEPVNAVIAALKDAGVDEKDIQTNYTNLSPIYDWSAEEQRVTGYEMRTSMKVSGVDIDAVSGLMQTCVAAGATGVDGPSYYVSSYEDAYQQALADAVAAAKPKAEAIAKAAGASLGEVVSVTEGYENTTYRFDKAASTMDAGFGADEEEALEMDIAPGEVTIQAQVTVVYAIG